MAPKVSAEYMRERRGEILDAATKVFSQKGFHVATLDDISTEADVSKGSIYIHFESKEAMIDGLSQLWQTIDDEVFETAETMPRAIDGVAHVVKATIRRSQRADFKDSIRLGMFVWAEVLINPAVRKSQSKLGEEWARRFTALVQSARDQGGIGPAYSTDSVISFLGSLGGGYFLSRGVWDANPDLADAEKLVDSFIEGLSQG
ncbi:MAG TPA: TetR/AcrR family transcriptional regulator [Dehalococcoidia bacterium]|jgi:TetR/AcrR family fatty acid metabolism transcriptional regulator|nr:TetR/AcrR family transcriptional regulator [Dehalococcoidia bacterium]HIK89787.1 TetR/AcrR family transcriptional regulator [Dehalococcoidia bacterium]